MNNEFIEKLNRAKRQAKQVSEEGNIPLISSSMIEINELLEEIGGMKSSLMVELNDIKEEKSKKLAEMTKEINELKATYGDILNKKKNALITISNEFATLKSIMNTLKITGSNAKAVG